jgi:transaldolase
MKVTQQLHGLGQRIWLDNITRELLNSAILQRYISEYSVTGLPPNPTIFHNALNSTAVYDRAIQRKFLDGKPVDEVFIDAHL